MSVDVKKAVVAVACVVAIGVCADRLWPRRGRFRIEMSYGPRVCEACGHRFGGVPEAVMVECPKCHKLAAVRVHSYRCRACGEVFEAFRSRPADAGLARLDDADAMPPVVFKREGGEWVPFEELGSFQCPKCGSTDLGPHLPL